MRKFVALTVSLCAGLVLAAVGLAGAAGEGPGTIRIGPEFTFTADGFVTPKALSGRTLEPASLFISGRIGSTGGTPAAARQLIIEADKNVAFGNGMPTCSGVKLRTRGTKAVEAACGEAIIGEGKATVLVALPEQTPIPVKSKLLLVNGGTKGGTTTWFVHCYFNEPISRAIVTPVKITKKPNGRYGTYAVASIPQILGGTGSLISFDLTTAESITGAGGKTRHPIEARCPRGELRTRIEVKFADGTSGSTEIVRACTPTG